MMVLVRWGLLLPVIGAMLVVSPQAEALQGFDLPTYTDPVARLQQRIDSGEIELEYRPGRGYLESLLDALNVPSESQTFVFSKTSLQFQLIDPDEPRALYFNDDVYVGFVQRGTVLELGSVDPVYGTVFYTLSQEPMEQPEFAIEGIRCISCHLPSRPGIAVPSLMVMSVMPNDQGEAIGTDVALITEASPLPRRWGGWYVTGTGGNVIHRGNSVISGDRGPEWAVGVEPHLTSLAHRFDVSPYLRGDSDIVALLLLVHQSEVHNLIGHTSYAAREAIQEEDDRERFLPQANPEYSDRTLNRIAEVAEPMVRAMFFADATPLRNSVGPHSEFAEEFMSRGIRDSQGRSLKDLDLEDRLLRYPMSYLVYTEQFDALPDLALDYVYRRFFEILLGEDTSGDFAHLTSEDRNAIIEILEETKPEFSSRLREYRSLR